MKNYFLIQVYNDGTQRPSSKVYTENRIIQHRRYERAGKEQKLADSKKCWQSPSGVTWFLEEFFHAGVNY